MVCGKSLGAAFGKRMMLVGGAILIVIGVRTLLAHML
jgi:putative Mn2+ efflux pump MntP